MIKPPPPVLPMPNPGDRVCFMGNTGEGKSKGAQQLLLAQPDAIIVNTKHDPEFEAIGVPIVGDRRIYNVGGGRFDFRPSDEWLANVELQEQFLAWALEAGDRVIYLDEVNDIAPNAQRYPRKLQKIVKQGRWRRVGLWVATQEPIRCPSFLFGQSQHRYLWHLGWAPHRKAAEAWFEESIPWDLIPERSHRFLLKTPEGTFGPCPPIDLST